MALVTMKELLDRADKGGRAVGAFNVGNMEMVIGAIRAAEDTKTPIILQIAEKRMKHSPLNLMAPMMVQAAKDSSVDIAVHLDHGLTLDCIDRCLDFGFTSVMLDASLLPLDENVALTKVVREKADRYGATVESELGVVGGNEGDSALHEIICTDPDVAEKFVDETGIDCLAVAIGNAHGFYKGIPNLRFDVLKEIHSRLENCPLVLHGGTGISNEQFRKAISLGIRKINIATASFSALATSAKNYCDSVDKADYFSLSPEMVQGVYENVKRHILVFNND